MRHVYIPSHDRVGSIRLPERLSEEDIEHTLVVYPEEADLYIAAYPESNVLVVRGDVRGIGQKRQVILDHAREAGQDWIWQIDDDVRHMHQRIPNTQRWTSCEFREGMGQIEWEYVDMEGVASVCLGSRNVTWTLSSDVSLSRQSVFVLMDTRGTWNYQQDWLWEDVDLTLQMLLQGKDTLLLSDYSYSAGLTGAEGGNHEAWNERTDSERELIMARYERYPKLIRRGKSPRNIHFDKTVLRRIRAGGPIA